MANSDIDNDFFETLAGKKDNQAAAKDLRETLIEEANTIKEAENTQHEPIPASEKAKLDAAKQALIEKGIFKPQAPTNKPPKKSISDFFSSFFSMSNMGGLATAASVLLVSFIVINNQPKNPMDDIGAIRGEDTHVLLADDPNETVQKLTSALQTANANVISAQINEVEWSIEISSNAQTDIERLKQILKDNGIKQSGEPPYTLTIKNK